MSNNKPPKSKKPALVNEELEQAERPSGPNTRNFHVGNPYPKVKDSLIKKAQVYYDTVQRATFQKELELEPGSEEAKREHARALIAAKLIPFRQELEDAAKPTPEEIERARKEENRKRREAAIAEKKRQAELAILREKERQKAWREKGYAWYDFAADVADRNKYYAQTTTINSIGRTLYYKRYRALIISVAKYEGSVWKPLVHPHADARALQHMLKGHGFEDEDVTVIKDEAATKRLLQEAFETFAEQSRGRPDDFVLIALFMRGKHIVQEFDDGTRTEFDALIPQDCHTNLLQHMVPDSHFKNCLEKIESRHVMCLSYMPHGSTPLNTSNTPPMFDPWEGSLKVIKGQFAGNSRIMLVPAEHDSKTVDGGSGRITPFMDSVLSALTGGAASTMGILRKIAETKTKYRETISITPYAMPGHAKHDSFWAPIKINKP